MAHHIEQRILLMVNEQIMEETSDIEVLREELIKCHHKNMNDSIQQVNMYIYDLTVGMDFYVIEYDDTFKLLVGLINPLKTRNSIKIKIYSLINFKDHQLMYKYLIDTSLLNTLSNLESNEYLLIKRNML